MIGIYKITNLATNEIYIGSSVNIKHRWTNHRSPSKWKQCPNSKLYADMRSFGLENFEFSVVEECEISDLKKREDFYIQSLRPQYNSIRAYNPDCKKNYKKTYYKTEEYKNYQKNYQNQLCNFQGETLTLLALRLRFSRQGISHPFIEAKKYLV